MLKKMIGNEFIHARNREIHTEELAKRLEERIERLIFDDCCAVVKQVQAGIPQENVRIWLRKVLNE